MADVFWSIMALHLGRALVDVRMRRTGCHMVVLFHHAPVVPPYSRMGGDMDSSASYSSCLYSWVWATVAGWFLWPPAWIPYHAVLWPCWFCFGMPLCTYAVCALYTRRFIPRIRFIIQSHPGTSHRDVPSEISGERIQFGRRRYQDMMHQSVCGACFHPQPHLRSGKVPLTRTH